MDGGGPGSDEDGGRPDLFADVLSAETKEEIRGAHDKFGARRRQVGGACVRQDYIAVEGTGGAVYDSALVLSDFLLGGGIDSDVDLAQSLIIELGTGTGAVSTALAHRLGYDAPGERLRLVATDGCIDAFRLAKANFAQLKLQPPAVEVRRLRWGDDADLEGLLSLVAPAALAAQSTVILMSDVIYPGSDLDALITCLRSLTEALRPLFVMAHVDRDQENEAQFLRRVEEELPLSVSMRLRWTPHVEPEAGSTGTLYVHVFEPR